MIPSHASREAGWAFENGFTQGTAVRDAKGDIMAGLSAPSGLASEDSEEKQRYTPSRSLSLELRAQESDIL